MLKKNIQIGKHAIGEFFPPFLIAELSANHNGSLKTALKLVREASRCGCHAIKLQTYTPDTLTMNCSNKYFQIRDKRSLWFGYNLYKLYQSAYTPWEWHEPIFNLCRQLGIIGFSTAFDETSVDFLEKLHVPAYKIASFEITHLPLIKKVARTGKPVIFSTGMASLEEIRQAVNIARKNGARAIALLKCTSAYPALPIDANVRTIPDLAAKFQCPVGISDHTRGIGVSLASIPLGARIIERHFILNRKDGSVDSAFSLEPAEMSALVIESKQSFYALGKISYGASPSEQKSLKFRQSIFAIDDIKSGEIFTNNNIRIIRPANGLSPQFYFDVLGKKSTRAIKRGQPLTKQMIERGDSLKKNLY
jgi:pseudaminic acid synthase